MEKQNNNLKIISLGGFGHVTKNMFVYETPQDILIVDCGMGFPDEEMLGVDLVIPDITYLKDKYTKIRGIVLTHGHEDHIGALPYLLPKLPKVPIFGSRLVLALLQEKLKENRLMADLREINRQKELSLGSDFKINFIQVTHSIPETFHFFIKTPYGNIYHGTDFKFDWTPIDGARVEVEKMVEASRQGVLFLLSDCLRSERGGHTPSEHNLIDIFEREIRKARGRFIVTTMSSNISRLKTAIDVSRKFGRRVALVGRSIERVIKISRSLGYINFPENLEVKVDKVKNYPPRQVTLLVAGSQAQTGSALDRIASGEHRHINIQPGDTVVFSSDYIPGNESSIQLLVDLLMRKGAEVSYMDISEDLHVSGHGAQDDLSLLISLVKPQFLLPIGGGFRQMKQYALLAQRMGYKKEVILLPQSSDIICVGKGRVSIGGKIEAREVMVDGLGVGDVGKVILRDREVLAKEGVAIAILGIDQNNSSLVFGPEIVSRGFIYGQIRDGREILDLAREEAKAVLVDTKNKLTNLKIIREKIQSRLEKFFYKTTGRWPMVLVVVIKV
ncbi:ribonuclease J [Candidatus Shapirobacteria bacterium CG09_land_8_20_14_0_10_38_17]|uniref:Ribonuclease J n=1 Tax=Candidatus Shapirobacteria bacterium CG09_land_8_20_14_0_10_38_17 TaxID=1974884 RepID=A0A2H0WQN5_9BACT|nr:MAG: ribonuclease J [Candidatus Shapirobacteria bacterium CG09_land_8_20_14_0_10_38_17]